ncbi:MAG: glutathione synthase [Gammaproteobacteria bacterium]|nr:glutathione synthase [Gammaproteobacteria bacterium]
MTVRLGVVMDPIGSIKTYKDSTFAMLLAAQARGWELRYMELADLYLDNGTTRARHRGLEVTDRDRDWFAFTDERDGPLADLDVVLMRKDPPFDTEYIYATYLLERAEQDGALVVNRPQALRDTNEKLAIARFPQCAPPTLVTREAARLRAFAAEHGDVILKPLHGMGGASVFRLQPGDPNLSVVIETLTGHGTMFAMAQRYLPEIADGDKRILLIDGEPVPYALARIPAPGETRGNLAAGATGRGVPLEARDRAICAEVGPWLRDHGMLFVGLDVIGDHLTEINVTSPTCIRELDAAYGLDIAGQLLDCIERRLA